MGSPVGPLAHATGGLELATALFTPFIPLLSRILAIEIEYTPEFDVFRDQSGLAGVDCDVLVEYENLQGQRGVLVIETKFVEPSFSSCGHCKKERDACPADVKIGSDFQGCRYSSKNGFLYWQRSKELATVHLPSAEESGCAFHGPLWQIWVNHTLAHAEAARRGAATAFFAVCAPRQNDTLNAEALLAEFRQFATHPATILFIPLEDLLHRLTTICPEDGEWQQWTYLLQSRYIIPPTEILPQVLVGTHQPVAVTRNHRKVIEWMETQTFRDIVAMHRVVCGERAVVYFR